MKLNGDSITHMNDINVTENQVAIQLLRNGKSGKSWIINKTEKLIRDWDNKQNSFQLKFTISELNKNLKEITNGKAWHEIMTEQIKKIGTKTKQWLLNFLNFCRHKVLLPKIWRNAKITTLLKPDKDYKDPKSYRPISYLCHTFKLYELYEWIIINRIKEQVERKLIAKQAGFRPGNSYPGQVLNLCHHIKDGY